MRGVNAINKLAGSRELTTSIGAEESEPLGRQEVANVLPFAYKPVAGPVYQHLGCPGARIVIRRQHHAVGAGIQNGQQVTFMHFWQFAIAGEKVTGLADGADDVDVLRLTAAPPQLHGHDLMVSSVKGRAHQIIHGRVENQELPAVIVFSISYACEQNTCRPDNCAPWFK